MGNIGIQAIGFVGSILYFLSFQCKGNKNLFPAQSKDSRNVY